MPCTLVCLVPVVVGAWPAIVSSVAGAAAALGFSAVSSADRGKVDERMNTVEVELEGSSVLEGYVVEKRQFIKDRVELSVETNGRGRVILRLRGNESNEVLRRTAREFVGGMKQVYAYDKAMTQLRQSGFNVVDETVETNGEIRVTLRRWR